jgi:hypothetical protein
MHEQGTPKVARVEQAVEVLLESSTVLGARFRASAPKLRA